MVLNNLTRALLLCCGILLWAGCNSQPAPAPAAGGASATDASHDEDGHGHDHAHPAPAQGESASMEGLDELSAEDKALAVAQKICPVGDGPLGGMGTPVKVEHEGNAYLLCCEHCREPFLKEPAKYIAKLEEKKAE